ncbi:MAG: right-handed parallel beta-helix repeat-containing protein [Proteobacteria bacterium]|nr:right-handed parallel beta-helix repeat-containing protein [Pseudomonadota bacterium]
MALHQNIKPVLNSFILLLLPFLLVSCQNSQTLELEKQHLTQDTTWNGVIIIAGDIFIEPNVTLTIEPGTIIKFKRIDETSDQNLFDIDSPYYPQAEIIIRGTLIARGTRKKKIVFTSAEIDARPSDWGALNFLGSTDNIIDHAKVLFAYNGVHSHGSAVTITNSEFAKCGVGISFKSEEETPGVPWFGKRSELTITGNILHSNKGGIGYRNSTGNISYNLIENNKFFGLWPKESVDGTVHSNTITDNKKGVLLYQTRGLVMTDNNIYDNRDYNISVATAQDFPVDARNNWFGTINSDKIDEMIFDQKEDADLGLVTYEPYLQSPVKWENP